MNSMDDLAPECLRKAGVVVYEHVEYSRKMYFI